MKTLFPLEDSVLHIALSNGRGGLEKFVVFSSLYLQKEGINTGILTFKDSWIERMARDFGITVFTEKSREVIHRYSRILIHSSKDLHWIFFYLRGGQKLIFRVPILQSVKKQDPIHRYLYRKVNLFIANSNKTIVSLLRNTPAAKNRIKLFYPPINHPKCSLRKKGRNIIFISRFEPNKRHIELLEAFSMLRQTGYKLILVGGGDGSLKRRIKWRADSLKIPLLIYDYTDDIWKYLSESLIFVYPSRGEAFGTAALEAAYCKNVIIVSNDTGVSEVIKNGENGFVYPSGNVTTLANRIKLVIGNKKIQKELSENARKLAEKFLWEKRVKNFIRIIQI